MRVGDIKRFNSQLQFVVFVPRQVEGLGNSHVEIDVTRQPEHVSISGFPWERIAEASVGLKRITVEEPAASCRTRFDRRIGSYRVALRVPVCCPASIVEWSADG